MDKLSPKELKILKMVCQDKTNPEMAVKMNFGLRYVEKIKTKLYKKTRTKSNVGLLKWAVVNGVYEIKKR